MIISLDADGRARLDSLLVNELHALYPQLRISRRWLKGFFAEHRVRIDGKAQAPSAIPARGTCRLEIDGWDPEAVAREFVAQPSPGGSFIPVVYEDDDILVLDKPPGVASVPHSGLETGTAVNSALAHCPALPQVRNSPLEPGLVHRLDTATGGLLLFAKNRREYLRLKKLWKTGAVIKMYRARVAAPPGQGLIEIPLGHARRSSGRMIAIRTPADSKRIRGKALPARTEILEVKAEAGDRYRLLVRLHTGVMHQIRCHLAAIGSPILGDELYGGPRAPGLELKACRLSIPLRDGSRLELTVPD